MPRRIALIVNPSAGGGRTAKVLPAVEADLLSRGMELHTERTRSLQHAQELASAAADAGEVAVTLSGDGMAGAVAHVLRGREGALMGVLPGGRGNDFARKLGIPEDPLEACAVIANGVERAVDVGEVDGHTFLGIASFGFDTVVQERANASKVQGGAVYLVSTLRELRRWRATRFTVSADGGEERSFDGYAVAACNSGVFGGGMYLVPHSSLEDGLLDVALSKDTSKLAYLRNLPKVFKGTHLDEPSLELLQARELHVDSDRPFDIYADGDPVGRTPAVIRAVPGALRVLVPAEA